MVSAWVVPEASGFDWRQWTDDLVVFVHSTGATHALGTVASAVLMTMIECRGQALAADALLDRLGGPADIPGPVDLTADAERGVLLDALHSLERLGLIQQVSA